LQRWPGSGSRQQGGAGWVPTPPPMVGGSLRRPHPASSSPSTARPPLSMRTLPRGLMGGAPTALPLRRPSAARSASFPRRGMCAAADEDEEAAVAFMAEIGYRKAVAEGVVRALKQPGSGVPRGGVLTMVKSMAGRWEVGIDAGLEALARAVEVEVAEHEGKEKVRFWVEVPHAGGHRFECEGLEGMSLRDVREHGGMEGGEELGEYLECACSGVMACSTCHVIVDDEWFPRFSPPCEAELDMLDLAYEPQDTSRLGCQLILSPEVQGFVIRVPAGAHNLFDHIPFQD